ncbi:BufA2 family periplasmic bufferin-type metallophore [Rhodoblastus sp.]|uniref:BufA2 family periplasmic bufferin-type metallophore n=1 Tax=Rhodoblastus sp. TaxID=1962975 RepID=UPI003F9C41DA
MQIKVVSGASLAAAAIALAVSGAALAPTQAQAKKAMVHCMGVNACKGKGACKSAKNACKGQNACKGMGWLPEKSTSACTKAGGTVG